MKVNDTVKDLTGDFGNGSIIDLYVNRTGDVPVVMYIVKFGDDQVFDRYEHEIELAYTVTISVPSYEADQIKQWLDSGKVITDSGECETVKTYSAAFHSGIEVDIKVCNGDTEGGGPYIDAVMFENGNEVGFLDVRDTLMGEYIFEDENQEYIVWVEKGS